jgi:hypothetical protein
MPDPTTTFVNRFVRLYSQDDEDALYGDKVLEGALTAMGTPNVPALTSAVQAALLKKDPTNKTNGQNKYARTFITDVIKYWKGAAGREKAMAKQAQTERQPPPKIGDPYTYSAGGKRVNGKITSVKPRPGYPGQYNIVVRNPDGTTINGIVSRTG